MRTIMGIQVGKREECAVKIQELLTKHGCIIKTRLGLHDTYNFCSSEGLILLEFEQKEKNQFEGLEAELNQIDSVVAKRMEF